MEENPYESPTIAADAPQVKPRLSAHAMLWFAVFVAYFAWAAFRFGPHVPYEETDEKTALLLLSPIVIAWGIVVWIRSKL